MSSKRWFDILLLIALIHLGVIGFLWRQGWIASPHWVDAQIVRAADPAQGAEASTSATDSAITATPAPRAPRALTASETVQNDHQAAAPRAEGGVQSVSSSTSSAAQPIPAAEKPTVSRSNAHTVVPSGSAVGSSVSGVAANRPATAQASPSSANGGGDLTLPSHIGGYLHNPKPPYPTFSQDAGEQGVVTLLVMVEADGHPSSVDVVKSSGFSRLDRSARETVLHQYRFIPATRGGTAIPYRYRFSIPFVLK